MSTPPVTIKNDFISLDPNKELSSHSCKNKMWKAAAIATGVAYAALAVVALILSAVYAPIYIPIVITGAVILADFVINTVIRYFDDKAEGHKREAKINQGMVDELAQIPKDEENRFLTARINYFEKYVDKCHRKVTKHTEAAQAQNSAEPEMHLVKAGKWTQKRLINKVCTAYCMALLEDPSIPLHQVLQPSFQKRALDEKFMEKEVFVRMPHNGVEFSSFEVEIIGIRELKDYFLNSSVE